jgi:hypothetical protein
MKRKVQLGDVGFNGSAVCSLIVEHNSLPGSRLEHRQALQGIAVTSQVSLHAKNKMKVPVLYQFLPGNREVIVAFNFASGRIL